MQESFIKLLAVQTSDPTVLSKRKTISKGDLLKVIHRDSNLEFLRMDFPKEAAVASRKEKERDKDSEGKVMAKAVKPPSDKKTKGLQDISSFFASRQ
jgi:hypothetical protein